jgi:hypothetical protein
MATPLLSPLRVQGGTFYTFTSSAEDISKTFTDDDTRFVFSKYALIDIPDVRTPSPNRENFLVWEGIGSVAGGGTSSVATLSVDDNINVAQSLQNYTLNFEQLILDGSNTLARSYNQNELYTVSERIFWKWMAQINAIRFRNATSSESSAGTRFVEEDPSAVYNRVVKYLGDIDIINNVSRDGHSYSEIYLNVPTQHGNTPFALFKTLEDSNYFPAGIWSNGNTYIDGRDAGSSSPSGLDLRAYYDSDTSDYYATGATFGLVTNNSGFAKISTGSSKPVLISNMDGAVLDFDASSYRPIVDDPGINIIPEWNASGAAGDFSFNAVLVYYDVYQASNPTVRARNLYGILFLDDYTNASSGFSFLKRFDKYKPNPITKLNGNSYGLKLNLKFDTSADNVGVETIINDYNTFSMDLFIDASVRLQEAGEMFLKQKNDIVELRAEITNLKNLAYSQGAVDLLTQRLNLLERQLNNARLAFSSETALLDLINKNSEDISNILGGKTSISLTYDLGTFMPGSGILIDKSVPNQIKIINRKQNYDNFVICKNTSGQLLTDVNNGRVISSTTNGNVLVLGEFTNYYKQKNTNADPNTGIETFQDSLYINIDDSSVKWKKGQTFRLVFSDPIATGGYNIIFRTDASNILGNGSYGKIIYTILSSELLSSKPIIEITCTDDKGFNFELDILR